MRIDRVKLATEMARREMRYIQLAKLAGISRITMSGINGGKAIHPDTANKIAQALNIPLEEIIEKALV